MEAEINVAMLSLVGTCLGSIFGILAANKLTVYRIEQLEKKMDKHNNVIEKVFILQEQTKVINKRLDAICEHMKLGGSE